MPLIGRRRPLARAAMVGGAGYAAGKHRARREEQEAEPDAALAEAQAAPVAPAPVPAPSPMSQGEQVAALKNLKELLDSGVLTQAEFDQQKQKILNG